MDLGQKIESPSSEPVAAAKDKEPRVSYPSTTLNDKVAEDFLNEYECDLGDEITFTGRAKITALRKDEYGKSVGMDLTNLDDVKIVGEEDEGEGESEKEPSEKEVLGYERPESKNEAPDTSAADLED